MFLVTVLLEDSGMIAEPGAESSTLSAKYSGDPGSGISSSTSIGLSNVTRLRSLRSIRPTVALRLISLAAELFELLYWFIFDSDGCELL